MRHSMHLGLLLALGMIALVSCGDEDPESNDPASAGTGGSSNAGSGGKATGGTATGGSTASGGSAGNAGSNGQGGASGGSGQGGTGGSAGSAGASGSAGFGQGGASGSAGTAGTAGIGGNMCDDDGSAGAGGDGSAGAGNEVTTAIVLLDNVVVKDAGNTNIVVQWQFDDDSDIVDSSSEPRPGDKWTRTPFSPIGIAAGAHNTFFVCDGNPTAGSLKNTAPFTADAQYYEVSVPFAPHDYASHHVTAKVKLGSGGRPDPACPARAELYTIKAADPYPIQNGPPVDLVAGEWLDLTLDIPSDFTVIDQVGFRITTYPCN